MIAVASELRAPVFFMPVGKDEVVIVFLFLIGPGVESFVHHQKTHFIGELKQFDVSDPAHPREVGAVHLGGVVRKTAHPAAPDLPLAGGPQMVEVSRDGKRIYMTNSLYGSWDDQFYPDGVGSWFAKVDTDPAAGGGLTVDERFFPHGDDFRGRRVHQTRLQGGDASSDSYCFVD